MGISTHIREENAMYLKNWLAALKEDPKFIYSLLSDVGKASGMIQEVSQSMHPYLSPEERFLTAVLKHDGKELEEMKKDGFIPSEKTSKGQGQTALRKPEANCLQTSMKLPFLQRLKRQPSIKVMSHNSDYRL